MTKVLIFTQIRDDEVEENTLGVINKIKQVFTNGEISAAFIGHQLKDKWIQDIGKHGIQKVYLVDTPETEVYLSRPYVKSMLEIIEAADPNLVIAAGTVYGEDLIPRLAIQNGVSCAQRVVDIKVVGENIQFHTPVRDDQAMQITKLIGPIQFITSRTGAFFVDENPSGGSPETASISVSFDDNDMVVKHVEIRKAEKTVDLKDAKVIVAGGRGVGGKDKFELLKEIADLLGGQIGATRACTDVHWIEETYEIGQTGQSVSPDLYIAAGISGAPQHMSGVKAKTVIAINTDEGAPIFNYADYGIVADMHAILPILKEKIK